MIILTIKTCFSSFISDYIIDDGRMTGHFKMQNSLEPNSGSLVPKLFIESNRRFYAVFSNKGLEDVIEAEVDVNVNVNVNVNVKYDIQTAMRQQLTILKIKKLQLEIMSNLNAVFLSDVDGREITFIPQRGLSDLKGPNTIEVNRHMAKIIFPGSTSLNKTRINNRNRGRGFDLSIENITEVPSLENVKIKKNIHNRGRSFDLIIESIAEVPSLENVKRTNNIHNRESSQKHT
jgi:hypothetical protein